MRKPKKIVRGFSLTPYEISIIERESKARSLFNDSAALRQILRDYEAMKAQLEKTNGGRPEPTAA